jgi:very-short-patch-repair endonuclease
LAIEVDGPVHDEQVEYDAARTQALEELGYRVIRFRNEEVLTDLDSVLRRIYDAALEGHDSR